MESGMIYFQFQGNSGEGQTKVTSGVNNGKWGYILYMFESVMRDTRRADLASNLVSARHVPPEDKATWLVKSKSRAEKVNLSHTKVGE